MAMTQHSLPQEINELADDLAATLTFAVDAARARGADSLTTVDVLAAILADESTSLAPVWDRLAGTKEELAEKAGSILAVGPSPSPAEQCDRDKLVRAAKDEARSLGAAVAGPAHLLIALVDRGGAAAGVVAAAGGTVAVLRRAIGEDRAITDPGGPVGPWAPAAPTQNLLRFGKDWTELARVGRLDPLVGGDAVLQRVIQVLSRRTKSNPVLIGEPGVGKTTIAAGLAQRIVAGDVPASLQHRRLVALDLAALVAGAKFRGEFEERLKGVLSEIAREPEATILFVDELHTMVGAGAAEGSIDAANVLKPMLARGEVRVLGATTIEEYRLHVERDAALERRFQPVLVPVPDVSTTVTILKGLRTAYEDFHGVEITDESLVAAAELSDRYITGRFLPDKAVDLVDEAAGVVAAAVGTPGALEPIRLGVDEIADVVARWTGIPVSKLQESDAARLVHMEEHLHRRVIGHEAAVRAVSDALRNAMSGLGDPERPIGSFLFTGPSGVGKTLLAQALAEFLFATEDAMVRLDMSEFMEREAVTRLIGPPPGYVGFEHGGQLTEAVRGRPFTVVLLDEIEKAHRDVQNVLLQIMDDGRLTDGRGRTVDFRNVIVIMTSNLGGAHDPEAAVRAHFRPEFLSRLDEVVAFGSLTSEHLARIADIEVDDVVRRAARRGVALTVTPAARARVADSGVVAEEGARPLRRLVRRSVLAPIASALLSGAIAAGDRAVIDIEADEFVRR